MAVLSAQSGTAQAGLSQAGQFAGKFTPPAITINASGKGPLVATAAALSSGGQISGGAEPIVIRGAGRAPAAATVQALSAGASMVTPGLAKIRARTGFWWWYGPADMARQLIGQGFEGE